MTDQKPATAQPQKSTAYREGRRAGSAGKPESANPYPSHFGEHGDWRTGHTDGWADIGSMKAAMRALRGNRSRRSPGASSSRNL